jgi:phosphoribosyl 1,2-cyclic phosphodiesterase
VEILIVKVCILASSSSGNCTFIATERTRLLVDAGLSRKEIQARLAAIGEDVEKLDAVLITHEHSDHVCGVVSVTRNKKRNTPVFITRLTAGSIPWNDYTPSLDCFQAGTRFVVGDIDVQSFTTPHDAIDPVGFTFEAEGVKVGVVTDLGYVPESIKIHLRDVNLLLMESNHDLDMLKDGPYPWSVRQRIMGRKGHLSNEATCRFIRQDLDSSVSTLILGHISEHTNHPARVALEADRALNGRRLFTRLVVAEPRQQSEVFCY